MDGGGRSDLQPPFVSDYPPTWPNISPPLTLINVVYIYQWIRVDANGSSNPTNVGSDSITYVLVPADEGKKLKVQVSFTDDAGSSEQRTSDAYRTGTGTVAPVDPATLPQLSFRESGQVTSEGTTTPYQMINRPKPGESGRLRPHPGHIGDRRVRSRLCGGNHPHRQRQHGHTGDTSTAHRRPTCTSPRKRPYSASR